MLEWLKAILGDGYNEEIDKQISAEIGKGFVAKADFNAAKEAQRGTAEQLAAANKELEEYKGMDIEGLRKSAADWQAKAEQAEKDADARVAAFQFDAKLDHAITAARGRNGKAIRALLDLDALRTSKDPDKDIAAALTAVQKDNGYMFDPAAAGNRHRQHDHDRRQRCRHRNAQGHGPAHKIRKGDTYYGKCNRTRKELCPQAGRSVQACRPDQCAG